jgi:hypothetical protein
VLYLVPHVTSIAAIALYDPVLHDANYVLGAGADRRAASVDSPLWTAARSHRGRMRTATDRRVTRRIH